MQYNQNILKCGTFSKTSPTQWQNITSTTIFNSWGKWALPLGDTPGPLEEVTIVSARSFRHGSPIPISVQEASDLGAHPVPLHDLHCAPLVQCAIGLVDIYKYIIQDLIPHTHNLLENFFLQGFCPSSSMCY